MVRAELTPGAARSLALTGRLTSAEECARLGLFDEVLTPPADQAGAARCSAGGDDRRGRGRSAAGRLTDAVSASRAALAGRITWSG